MSLDHHADHQLLTC